MIRIEFVYLLIAIVGEVVATSALKASQSFSRPGPSLLVVAGYGVCFYFLSAAVRVIPLGVAYALWSGIGIVFICLAGFIFYRQTIDLAGYAGIALIMAGVLVLNLFSKSVPH